MASRASGPSQHPSIVVLTGPTAVGKTDLSIALAQALDGEIISADSVQVYRQLDVGSDKISLAARKGVPHHLLDILSPEEDFSAGVFHDLAWAAVEDIVRRKKTPIVVGGTGLYLDWFMRGKPGTPVSTPQTAAAAQARMSRAWTDAERRQGSPLQPKESWEAGCQLVEELGDAASAALLRAEPNNRYRMERVVEILLASPGCRLADFSQEGKERYAAYSFHPFFLVRPRIALYRRIDARVEYMVCSGLLGEAAMLLERGAAPNSTCATRAIGYRQALLFLEALRDWDEEQRTPELLQPALIQLVRDIQAATRKLCHRQLTWFRNRAEFAWLDATQDTQVLLEHIHGQVCRSNPVVTAASVPSHGGLTAEEQYALKRYQPAACSLQDLDGPGSRSAMADVLLYLSALESRA